MKTMPWRKPTLFRVVSGFCHLRLKVSSPGNL
jgi:hypothetical protein